MGFFCLGKSEEQKREEQIIDEIRIYNMENVPFNYEIVSPGLYSWAVDTDYGKARNKALHAIKEGAYRMNADCIIACKISQSCTFGCFSGLINDKTSLVHVVDITGVSVRIL